MAGLFGYTTIFLFSRSRKKNVLYINFGNRIIKENKKRFYPFIIHSILFFIINLWKNMSFDYLLQYYQVKYNFNLRSKKMFEKS